MFWVLRNRVGPAELTDRRCDVGDLFPAVRARVGDLGNQPVDHP